MDIRDCGIRISDSRYQLQFAGDYCVSGGLKICFDGFLQLSIFQLYSLFVVILVYQEMLIIFQGFIDIKVKQMFLCYL